MDAFGRKELSTKRIIYREAPLLLRNLDKHTVAVVVVVVVVVVVERW